MGRVETVDAPGIDYPLRSLAQQKTMKQTKSTLKWMGRAAPDTIGGEFIDANPTRQSSQKEDTGQRVKHSSPSVTLGDNGSVRTRAQQISCRDPSTETGRTGGRIIDHNPNEGDNVAFELFKKEFIEKLAEKAKERSGYLPANEDFAKPGKYSPKHLKQADEDFVKPVQVRWEPKQTFEDLGKPRQADPKHLKQTETFERPGSFVGSPNLKRDILERTVRIIESSKTLRSSSFDKRKSGPVQEKFGDPSWMSKCDKLNLGLEKQAWSKEGTSKDFILNKFFQTPTKPASPNSYEAYGIDEDAAPLVCPSRKIVRSTEHKNGDQKTNNVGKQLLSRDETKNPGRVTMQREKRRECEEFVSGATLVDHIPFLRKDLLKSSSGSSGRISSSDDTSKETSRSPGRRLSSEDRSKDSSRSAGSRLSFEDRRKDSSRSPGRRLSSEQKRNDLSRSPGRKSSSEERRTDFSLTSTRSIDGVCPAEDLRTRDQTATKVLNESRFQATRPESPGRQSNSGRKGNRRSESEPEHESVRREKEALSNSLKKAAAVDQAHFLRALQDAGAVQSSTPMSSESEMNRPGYSSVKDASLRRQSSPNGTKNSNNLREATGNHRVDPRRVPSTEIRETGGREPSPTGRREVGPFGSSTRSRDPSPTGRRDATSVGSSYRSREPSPTSLRDTVSFGSSTRSREPSPTGRRDAAGSFGSSTRSREPSPTGRREPTSSGSSSSTKSVRTANQRPSIDSLAEKGGEPQRKTRGERPQLPSGGNSPSRGSPRQLTRQSSSRSIGSDDSESVSGGSIIEKLMRKASLRNSLSSVENQSISSSAPASPIHESVRRRSSEGLRRTLSFAGVEADVSKALPESSQQARSSSNSEKTVRTGLTDTNLSDCLPKILNENNSTSHLSSVEKKSAASAPDKQHPLSNSLRVNVQIKESTIAKLKSRSSTSPVFSNSEKLATVKTAEESCPPNATPPPTSSVTPGGSPWSPGSDDSGSDASSIEQPSPVSVLSYNNRRTPFQEESRLCPLEHKIQVLHERVRKSKTDVTNQKKARLEKIKAREAELCPVTDLKTPELLGGEVPKASSQAPKLHAALDIEKKLLSASVIAVTRDEKLEKARLAEPDFCTSLEKFDLKSILPRAQDKKWDLAYIRDVLLASNFGRDRSTMTKWHSVTEPMDPSLFEKLEEFYRFGKKFPGSQFLSNLVVSIDGHHSMQEYVQRIFFNPVARHQGAVDTMNRCHLFDMVNETLAKKLVPYVAIPRPWMKPLAKPVVRPRATGSALMQEIWTDICDQMGDNGSMLMDKAQLHQSLEDLICEDLFKRTDLFPTREVERTAERVGIELERRILDDLLEETLTSLSKSV